MKKITKAWKEMSRRVAIPCGDCVRKCRCSHRLTSELSSSDQPTRQIPSDVPKGHLVVYVGKEEKYKRFVIKMKLLQSPIFRALLDQTRDEVYDDFTAGDSKLCIPCDESIFLEVLRCAGTDKKRDDALVS